MMNIASKSPEFQYILHRTQLANCNMIERPFAPTVLELFPIKYNSVFGNREQSLSETIGYCSPEVRLVRFPNFNNGVKSSQYLFGDSIQLHH